MSLAESMDVNVLHGVADMRIERRPVPEPGSGEVLIRIAAVGICGSDVHYYEHGRIADFVVEQPLVLGHEASGTIVSVGDGVPVERVGQRVALEPGVPCRACRSCKEGRYNLCPEVRFFATPPIDGTFAEYVVLAADFAHPVPDSLSDHAAALIEPLSVGVWACQKAGVAAGSSVLITGAGPIGLVTVQVARALGATDITVTDVSAERLELAGRCGAHHLVDVSRSAGDVPDASQDAFIECSGAPSAIGTGFPAVRPGGTVVLVGMGADGLTIPVGLLQNRELWVTGSFRYANTYPRAIALAAAGLVDLDSLVTGTYDLARAEEALKSTRQPGTIKSMVLPGNSGDGSESGRTPVARPGR